MTVQLPNAFREHTNARTGKKRGSTAFTTHCQRELFHAQLSVLLDDDFKHAYEHGIVVGCADGVLRRSFPRFFTYSSDYLEKYVPYAGQYYSIY